MDIKIECCIGILSYSRLLSSSIVSCALALSPTRPRYEHDQISDAVRISSGLRHETEEKREVEKR